MATLHCQIDPHRTLLIHNQLERMDGFTFTVWISADPVTHRQDLEQAFASTAATLQLQATESERGPTKWEQTVRMGDVFPVRHPDDKGRIFVDPWAFTAHAIANFMLYLGEFAKSRDLEFDLVPGSTVDRELDA